MTSPQPARRSAVLTLWFVAVANPADVLAAEPRADRGFGRKFLAQLNPAWPVTPIGQFPLNRSAQAGAGEYYIGGYPGVTVIQTVIYDEHLALSQLPAHLRTALPARDVYAFAADEATGYAGFAHWKEGGLKRSLCATPSHFVEDTGLPEPFEGPFWAGEHPAAEAEVPGVEQIPHPQSAVPELPFAPLELAHAAQEAWLGVPIGPEGPDLDVVGYAVDGRPEPRVDPAPAAPPTAAAAVSSAAAKLGLGPANADYDDYADPDAEPEPTISPAALDRVQDAAASAGSVLNELLRRAADGAQRALSLIKRNRR